jgi:hypothetical protein
MRTRPSRAPGERFLTTCHACMAPERERTWPGGSCARVASGVRLSVSIMRAPVCG